MEIIEINTYEEITLERVPAEFWRGFPNVKGKRVFLKPNLVTPETGWDQSSTTRVEVTELVIQKLRQEGAGSIVVGECGFKDQWETTMRSTEYDQLEMDYGVELIPLQDGPNFHKFTLTRLDSYRSLYGVKFSDYLLESDIVINLPKLKMHIMAGATGAIKNMMGTMAQKGSMHPRGNRDILHQRLADFYALTSKMVNYIVMDGIIGSEYSEQSGVPVHSGVLLSGTDQWEVDVAAARLMGWNPRKIPYLRFISKDFTKDFATVQVPKHLVKQYEKPLPWQKEM